MNKAEIVLELTKLISGQIINVEHKANSVNPNYPEALANAYNKIFDTISITDPTK
ncbi:hypothetical protein [Clostridium sp.]|uniref:hypothetical protein n=1 Tax=Clostridium sp. TaxID=1506 RepID=UPI00283F256F|nr:hypothetical protein [Clostridium sp.]MDR3593818.1 hypothetical protein [Clostridium sp.]